MFRLPVRARLGLVAGLLASLLVVLMSSPLAAHTGFQGSSPGGGHVMTEPVDEISLFFSGESTPVGEGFQVLGPDGAIRTPAEVVSDDNLTWTLRFDEPFAEGTVGVRWKVAAGDAHPIEGSFAFEVVSAAGATGSGESADTGEATASSALDVAGVGNQEAALGSPLTSGVIVAIAGLVLALGAVTFLRTGRRRGENV